MKFLVNGVEFNEVTFKSMVINSKNNNEDSLEDVMSELIVSGSMELSGDTFEIK